jgi:endonuclease/exonuclease/phosphatase family metal-dependent hydrolase
MKDQLTVLSFNLRFGLSDDGSNSWIYRKEGIAELLLRYEADFIGLQEVNDFQVDFVDSILADYAYIGRRIQAPHFWQNNVLFYRPEWQCVLQKHLYLSPTPEIPSRFSDSQWPRQCTIGLFKKDQKQLLCINTHFDFKPVVQSRSARFILDLISDSPSHLSVILMGDFNATPDSDCHRILTGNKAETKTESPCLRNVFDEPYPGTYHGFSGDWEGECIDWILYCGAVIPIRCDVIRSTFNGVYPSDHFPIYATFRWRNKNDSRMQKVE